MPVFCVRSSHPKIIKIYNYRILIIKYFELKLFQDFEEIASKASVAESKLCPITGVRNKEIKFYWYEKRRTDCDKKNTETTVKIWR